MDIVHVCHGRTVVFIVHQHSVIVLVNITKNRKLLGNFFWRPFSLVKSDQSNNDNNKNNYYYYHYYYYAAYVAFHSVAAGVAVSTHGVPFKAICTITSSVDIRHITTQPRILVCFQC